VTVMVGSTDGPTDSQNDREESGYRPRFRIGSRPEWDLLDCAWTQSTVSRQRDALYQIELPRYVVRTSAEQQIKDQNDKQTRQIGPLTLLTFPFPHVRQNR
jgi:hypothetical protein